MRRLKAIVAAAAALALAGEARANQISATYEGVAFGVLPFGRAGVDLSVRDDRYEARGRLNTTGLAALFSKAHADAAAHGSLADGAPAPARYSVKHQYMGAARDLSIDWAAADVAVDARPAFRVPGDPAPSAAQRRAGRDPVSTLAAMGIAVAKDRRCDGTWRVFDGHYVYDLTLQTLGPGRYRHDALDLPVLRCRLHQQRIAGYEKPEHLAHAMAPAEIWFATPPGAKAAIVARVTSQLPLGTATIRLTGLSVR